MPKKKKTPKAPPKKLKSASVLQAATLMARLKGLKAERVRKQDIEHVRGPKAEAKYRAAFLKLGGGELGILRAKLRGITLRRTKKTPAPTPARPSRKARVKSAITMRKKKAAVRALKQVATAPRKKK